MQRGVDQRKGCGCRSRFSSNGLSGAITVAGGRQKGSNRGRAGGETTQSKKDGRKSSKKIKEVLSVKGISFGSKESLEV